MERKTAKPILDKIYDYLGQRNHSELELRRKLSKFYDKEEIAAAIDRVQEMGLMTAPEELARQVAATLTRKGKSHLYIQGYLRAKGLPAVQMDEESEIAKAKKALAKRFMMAKKEVDPKKMTQFLKTRGFTYDVIQSVVKAGHDEIE